MIYEGFLSQSDLVTWIGREKHRKTNLVLQLAICAAVGRDFLHFRFRAPQPLRVVYVDYESKTQKLKQRYEAIRRSLGLSDEEKRNLKVNLKIIEIRRAYKEGLVFPRFPVRPDVRDRTAKLFKKDDEFWRTIVEATTGDLYIFDPMRSMHAQDENDSNIELLLARLRQFFRNAAVIVVHHMRKRESNAYGVSLETDMRTWSDGARGSVAIKAHADVFVGQERVIENEVEVVYWGAFSKDEADIDPMPLVESDVQSFFWHVSPQVPVHLRASFEALRKASGPFPDKTAASKVIEAEVKKSRATAFKHVNGLANKGLLVEKDGVWVVNESAEVPTGGIPTSVRQLQ